MGVINYLKGLMGFDQATKEKLRIRQEAIARWSEDEKIWLRYYMAQIPCTKPDLNKYLADPKYRWTPPNRPLPPGPRPI